MPNFYADFKEKSKVPSLDRKQWDDHRDLILENFPAYDKNHARSLAFEEAYKHLDEPFLGELREIEVPQVEAKKGIDMAGKQAKGKIVGELREYFEKHRGEIVSLYDLMKVTDFAEEQIRSSISFQRSRQGWPLEVIQRGKKWRLPVEATQDVVEAPVKSVGPPIEASSETDDRGFYMLNWSIDNEAVILQRDIDGTIWRAVRL